MKLLGQILLVCLAIGALQWLLAVAAVVLILLLIAGLIFRTHATVTLLAMMLLLKGLEVHPLATLSVGGALWAATWLADRKKRKKNLDQTGPTLLLPPPTSEPHGD